MIKSEQVLLLINLVLFIGSIFILSSSTNSNSQIMTLIHLDNLASPSTEQTDIETDKNRENNLELLVKNMSMLLKESMRRIGQLSCEISKNKNTNDDFVSTNGGWCASVSSRKRGHVLDTSLAASLSRLLRNKTVASLGEGPGLYMEYILKKNEVKSYAAFDGAPFVNETTDGQVEFLDLSVPVYHLLKYDWVVSLEVAEHIPARFEAVYIDNLVRHALEGIVLSWALPDQIGFSHVNGRDFSYVKTLMELNGFGFDISSTALLRKASCKMLQFLID